MAVRAGFFVGVAVAVVAVVGCAVALYGWTKGISHKPGSSASAALTVSALPAASTHAMLGPESDELRDLTAARTKIPDVPPHRPRGIAFHPDAFFVPSSSKKPLPSLHNVELTDARDDRTDDLIRSLTDEAAGRKAFLQALKNEASLRARLEPILAGWKVPDVLLAIAVLESGFSPLSENGRRAGLWGLRPEEAVTYGLYISDKYDERRAVVNATEVAAHHLKALRDRLGTWELTIAAYGVGYKAALELAKHAEGRPFWSLVSAGLVPDDILTYVRRVIATAVVIANEDAFDIHVSGGEVSPVSDLEVPSGTPFSVVAEAAAVPIETIREYNPEILSDVVPPTDFTMFVHLPSSSLARARELLMPLLTARAGSGLARLAPRQEATTTAGSAVLAPGEKIFYRVRDADTLSDIAQHFGTTAERIAIDNALSATDSKLRPGSLLVIRRLETDNATTRPDASR